MMVVLNFEQAKALSSFFFDVAKGSVLGGMGIAATTTLEMRIPLVVVTAFFVLFCIKMGLIFLEDIK